LFYALNNKYPKMEDLVRIRTELLLELKQRQIWDESDVERMSEELRKLLTTHMKGV